MDTETKTLSDYKIEEFREVDIKGFLKEFQVEDNELMEGLYDIISQFKTAEELLEKAETSSLGCTNYWTSFMARESILASMYLILGAYFESKDVSRKNILRNKMTDFRMAYDEESIDKIRSVREKYSLDLGAIRNQEANEKAEKILGEEE